MLSRCWLIRAAVFLVTAIAVTGCGRAEAPKESEAVHFRSEDGFQLEGTIFGNGTKGVVLAHMFPADQSSWFRFAGELSSRGFQVLTFNFRGYGESQGDKEIGIIDRDVRSAARFLTDRGARSIGLVGASMGGTAALIAAATLPVDAVATISAPVTFRGLDASTSVATVNASKLFIAAKDDGEAADAADRLFRASTPPRDIQILAGNDHGTDIFEGSSGEEVTTLVIDFLNTVLTG